LQKALEAVQKALQTLKQLHAVTGAAPPATLEVAGTFEARESHGVGGVGVGWGGGGGAGFPSGTASQVFFFVFFFFFFFFFGLFFFLFFLFFLFFFVFFFFFFGFFFCVFLFFFLVLEGGAMTPQRFGGKFPTRCWTARTSSCGVRVTGERALAPADRANLLRIAQESVSNRSSMATFAADSRCWIFTAISSSLGLADNGSGFSVEGAAGIASGRHFGDFTE
jgi:hypothetical protein